MQSLSHNFVPEKDLLLCWKSGYVIIIWIVKYIMQFWYLIRHDDRVCIRKLSIMIQYHIATSPTKPIKLASLWLDDQSFRHCVVFKSRYRNILKCNCKSNSLGCIITVNNNVTEGWLSRYQIIWWVNWYERQSKTITTVHAFLWVFDMKSFWDIWIFKWRISWKLYVKLSVCLCLILLLSDPDLWHGWVITSHGFILTWFLSMSEIGC